MVTKKNYLLSEINELESIIESLPACSLQAIGFKNRLKSIQNELSKMDINYREPEKFCITFRGDPVSGSSAINADFGSKAMAYFTDFFSTVTTCLFSNIKSKGPIPNKLSATPKIVNVARGSFGFELELPTIASTHGEFPSLENDKENIIMDNILKALNLPVSGTDDEVADLLNEIHDRGLKKLQAFLNILYNHNAYIGLRFKNKKLQYDNISSVKRAISRLDKENIVNGHDIYSGKFLGILPESRVFEFKINNGDIVSGKINNELGDIDDLNIQLLQEVSNIQFDYKQVGEGKKRYTISSI